MDEIMNSNNSNSTNDTIDSSLIRFILMVDTCLAAFSIMNLIVNFSLLCLSFGFLRGRGESNGDTTVRRPHYALHFFIVNCVLSSVLLECIGTLTNVGFLITGNNILINHIDTPHSQEAIKKFLDFLTYAFFNVSHLNFVLLLNVDKLLYILRPLHYHELMNRKRVWLITFITWLVASAMATPSLTAADINSQVRQEAIVFSLCVVCPASFDLLSAIIVSTLVYKIQMHDSHTRSALKAPTNGATRRHLFSRLSFKQERGNLKRIWTSATVRQNIFRHCRVFLRVFTPIIWTCITTLPYTTTMMYLYFGADSNEDFMYRWTDINMFKTLRVLGCLYVVYFTGVPFIIVFNNEAYRKKIKSLTNIILEKLRGSDKPSCYSVVSKSASTAGTELPPISNGLINGKNSLITKDTHHCNGFSRSDV